ncbi:MAG: tetratricopeptide repeat protein, partial [Planctomycetota bacterium]|nr:tetratricopeptide repeat protein [Planctomycetota bacterium]
MLLALGPLCVAAGCAQPSRVDPTFRRGVGALAAGSPKSAIPFLTEAVESSPEDAKAHAMLAIAYALALEPDLAIQMVKRVHPDPGTIETPGWECVALGVAGLVQGRAEDAAGHFRRVLDTAPSPAAAKQAASQWLTLALLMKGDQTGALESLEHWRLANGTQGP